MAIWTTLAALSAIVQPASPAQPPVVSVAVYLKQCRERGEALWGLSLCAPVVIVDSGSTPVWTSEGPPGPLPPLRANTAFTWGVKTWIMLLAPLPGDAAALRDLLFHEAWHSRQQQLGLPANTSVAAHLDHWRARYLMRLEWNALRAALLGRKSKRRDHVRQALAFRVRRHGLSADAAQAERAQMRHEGVAAYTGAALSGSSMRRALVALEGGPLRPGLARSFAYVSGPAWGLLLDALRPGWRRQLRGGEDLPDLVDLLPAVRAAPDLYGGTALLQDEQLAGFARDQRLARALAATSEDTALRLPLAAMQMDFDPDQVAAAPDGSTLYHRISLRDHWGRLDASTAGLRISADFTVAYAPWPLPEGALQLASGWQIAARPSGGAELVKAP